MPDLLCDLWAEFPNPRTNGFVAHGYSSFCEQILDISKAQGKAMISPNSVGYDRQRKPMAFETGWGNRTNHRDELLMPRSRVNKLTIPSAFLVEYIRLVLYATNITGLKQL